MLHYTIPLQVVKTNLEQLRYEMDVGEFPNTEHVRGITISGVIHKNKVERMNREVRD